MMRVTSSFLSSFALKARMRVFPALNASRGFSVSSSKVFDEKKYTYTPELKMYNADKTLPTFRVIDLEGNVIAPQYDNIPSDLLSKIFETMVTLEEMDNILYMAQRQGKISFYMTSFGESACTVATGAALSDEDPVFPQYREQGLLMWRGFTLNEFVNQCASNRFDPAKGRQMPMHFTAKRLNWVCISSPLSNYRKYLYEIKHIIL
jgi:2-oxoisovalerate dehydrogenase E1 component alpha subunit